MPSGHTLGNQVGNLGVSGLGLIEPGHQTIVAFLVFSLIEGNVSVFFDALLDGISNSGNPDDVGMWEYPTTTTHNQFVADNGHKVKKNTEVVECIPLLPELNREEVLSFINKSGFLTFNIRDVRINDYLRSLLDMASLLTRYAVYREANDEVKTDITGMIRKYADGLRANGIYASMKKDVLQMKLSVQMYDVFGEIIKYGVQQELFMTFGVLDQQCSMADVKLGRHGYVDSYVSRYQEELGIDDSRIDCILFASNEDCLKELHDYAKEKFHAFNDAYRSRIARREENCRKEYDNIVKQGDAVSHHNLFLPETTILSPNQDGTKYYQHLYADEDGTARIKLNSWEAGTIEEEKHRSDFVCWLRNPSKMKWALCIHYKLNNEDKAMYPEFLVVRMDPEMGYVLDILEPHGDQYKDSLAKAKGMAEYVNLESKIGRVQMIREKKDRATGKNRYLRLDFSKTAVRQQVKEAMTTDEFDHLFDTMGVYDGV